MPETWFFDRLGENLDVPTLEIGDLENTVTAIRDHAAQHIETTSGYHLNGPSVHRRTLGGYRIVDSATGFTYGQARRSPIFGEKPQPILPPPIGSPTRGAL